jgi:solute carrier family 25 uncoupling protein 27
MTIAGSSPAVFRAAMVNLGELASYATAKDLWLQYTPLHDGVIVHTLSAIVSGFFAAVCSTPADVVKT